MRKQTKTHTHEKKKLLYYLNLLSLSFLLWFFSLPPFPSSIIELLSFFLPIVFLHSIILLSILFLYFLCSVLCCFYLYTPFLFYPCFSLFLSLLFNAILTYATSFFFLFPRSILPSSLTFPIVHFLLSPSFLLHYPLLLPILLPSFLPSLLFHLSLHYSAFQHSISCSLILSLPSLPFHLPSQPNIPSSSVMQ